MFERIGEHKDPMQTSMAVDLMKLRSTNLNQGDKDSETDGVSERTIPEDRYRI